jgi:hypothetical protein
MSARTGCEGCNLSTRTLYNFVILSNCMRIGGMAALISIGAIGAVRNCPNIIFNALFCSFSKPLIRA